MKKTNRQKKELLKKIEEMETWIAIDEEMGCGFAPPDAYDGMYEEIYQLQEKLAQLRHYRSVEEMLYDERGKMTVLVILCQEGPAHTRKQRPSQGPNAKCKNRASHKKSRDMSR